MANTIKQKRGTTDPGASDLVVGELAINTTDGGVFTKTDGGTVVEVGSGGGGASEINDLSDAKTANSGALIGIGTGALENNTSATSTSLAIGLDALNDQTTGTHNVAIGNGALAQVTSGHTNTAVGRNAGTNMTGGTVCTFVGYNAGKGATAGGSSSYSAAFGEGAFSWYSSANDTTAIGYRALRFVTTGSDNTALGYQAGDAVTTGTNNLFMGHDAGGTFTTGSNCTAIGHNAQPSSNTVSNEITFGDANVTSLRIPGLQSGASNGDVLTYNSTNGNITLAAASGGGASEINDLSDAVTYDSGEGIGLGTGALANDDGSDNYNTALGYNAGNATTSGEANVFVGYEAGSSRTTVGKSVCIGYEAGRYPNTYHTTAIGYQALKGSSSAQVALNNTAVGTYAGLNTQSTYIGPGGRNVFMGYAAAKDHTTGEKNVVIGATAGEHMTTGQKNVVIGRGAAAGETEYARRLTTGENNIVIGNNAEASSSTVDNEITLGDPNITSLRIPGLQSGASDGQVLTFNSTNGNITLADAGGFLTEDVNKNIYGGSSTFENPTLTGSDKADNNVAIGEAVMKDITGGDRNVGIGHSVMQELTMGSYNVGLGQRACGGLSAAAFTGSYNVALGQSALDSVTTGTHNIALGQTTLDSCTTGSYNIALGKNCLKDTTTGEYNIAMGEGSQRYASGSNNISMGYRTAHNISGSNNTLIGASILTSSSDSLSGSNNTLIGKSASPSSASVNNEMTLGHSGLNTLRCNQTSITSLSDGRDKINVAELGEGLDFVTRLKPVKFEWKTRDGNIKDGTYEAGFIAQDLQQLQKDTDTDYLKLVMDSNPDRLEASYGKLVPILVRAIQELKSEVEQLKANV